MRATAVTGVQACPLPILRVPVPLISRLPRTSVVPPPFWVPLSCQLKLPLTVSVAGPPIVPFVCVRLPVVAGDRKGVVQGEGGEGGSAGRALQARVRPQEQ